MAEFARLFIVCLILFGLLGCAGPQTVAKWADDTTGLVWPASPEAPRIKFLRSVSIADVGVESSGGRFLGWLVGEKGEHASLSAPYAVAADGDGGVWVTDSDNRLIHKFDLGRNSLDQWEAIGGVHLLTPIGLAYDRAQNRLLIADAGLRRVLISDPDGNLLGELQPPDGFLRPVGVAVDSQGRLYVADAKKGRVEVFSRQGEYQKSIGSQLTEDGQFNTPLDVAVTSSGRILVNDSLDFRIEVMNPDGSSGGAIGHIGDAPGSFARPRGIALDSSGELYVVDAAFGNVQIFDEQGRLLLYFGSWGDGAGEFSLPAGICIDQNDRIYVVDSYNHRVQIFQRLQTE